MSLPVRPQQHSSVSQTALHPGAMRKSVMNAGSNSADMRDAVLRAAQARQSGRGGRVMGGLSVGPTGQAQMPFSSAQHAVSGQRGRNAPEIDTSERQRHFDTAAAAALLQPQQNSIADGTRFLLIHDSQSRPSVQALQSLWQRHSAPHPRIMNMLASAVDINRPNNAFVALVQKLKSMPQFRRALECGCVLFDSSEKRAYDDQEVIEDLIASHKMSVVTRCLNEFFARPTATTPLSSDFESHGLPTHRPASHGANNNTPTASLRAFSRRSVVNNMSKEELEQMAKSASRYVRRDESGAQSSATVGNMQGATEGGAEGSLQQFNVKEMRI